MVNRIRSNAGYSIIELLVVVGIIGIICAFSVPAFLGFQRSIKMKGSLRQLASDIRSARQVAVTQRRPMKITFGVDPAGNRRSYEILIWNQTDLEWEPYPLPETLPRQLEDTIYFYEGAGALTFPNTTFPDNVTPEEDDRPDIVFNTDGTIRVRDNVEGENAPSVWLRSDDEMPFNQSEIRLQTTGNLTTVQSKWN